MRRNYERILYEWWKFLLTIKKIIMKILDIQQFKKHSFVDEFSLIIWKKLWNSILRRKKIDERTLSLYYNRLKKEKRWWRKTINC